MHVHTRIDRGPALRSVAARADGKRGGRFGPLARHASWLHAARKVGSRRSGSTCAVHARSDGRAVSAGVSATTLHDALSCATTRSAAVATIANKVAHVPRMRTALAGAVVQGQLKTRAAVFLLAERRREALQRTRRRSGGGCTPPARLVPRAVRQDHDRDERNPKRVVHVGSGVNQTQPGCTIHTTRKLPRPVSAQ